MVRSLPLAALCAASCVLLLASCHDGQNEWGVPGGGGGGSPADAPGTPEGGELPGGGEVDSFIWIANSVEGTVSKLDTVTGVELARYYTSPQERDGDPSRTSVNLHGDVAVTNRDPAFGDSSVTKFSASLEGCVDRNANGVMDTSHGPDEVLPWGEDECMLWNRALQSDLDVFNYFREEFEGRALGARATAWDGTEDPETGRGGGVWVGSMYTGEIFHLEGDTGEIVGRAFWSWATHTSPADWPPSAPGHGMYGAAMDGRGHMWIFDGESQLGRLDLATLEVDSFDVPCGYGIAVDARGRVWTAGGGCVNRFDPSSGENATYAREGCDELWAEWAGSWESFDWNRLAGCFFRGVAVDGQGGVWVADTLGSLIRFDEELVDVVDEIELGASEVVGVAVDYHGLVWAVSQGDDAALRVDPDTGAVDRFPVGAGPYTYSDMTGFQLRTVIVY